MSGNTEHFQGTPSDPIVIDSGDDSGAPSFDEVAPGEEIVVVSPEYYVGAEPEEEEGDIQFLKSQWGRTVHLSMFRLLRHWTSIKMKCVNSAIRQGTTSSIAPIHLVSSAQFADSADMRVPEPIVLI